MVRLVIRGILFFTAVGLFAETFFLRMNREGEEEIRRAMTPVAVFPFPAVSRREPAEAAIEIPAGREWKRFRDRWTSSGLILAWVEPSPRLPANGETIAVSGPDGDRDLPFSPGPPFAYLDPTTQLAGWILGRRLPATPGSRVIVRVLPDGEERRPGSLVVLPGMTAEENSARNLSLTGMRWREWSFTAVAVACLVGALFFGGLRRPDVPLGTTSGQEKREAEVPSLWFESDLERAEPNDRVALQIIQVGTSPEPGNLYVLLAYGDSDIKCSMQTFGTRSLPALFPLRSRRDPAGASPPEGNRLSVS